MRLKRTLADWLWLVALVIVYVGFAVMIAFWIAQASAAPKIECRPPDPRAAPVVKLSAGEIRALASLAWAEARGEADPYCSMQAVAAVVVNRMQINPEYFGASVTQVINRPHAFSPFGKQDPQRRKMGKVDESDDLFVTSLLAAIAAVSGADPVAGATHFYSGRPPDWAARMLVTARIGGHTFMRSR
jgi:spore germination cell wall hydrolase CwlJ-like protein